MKILIGWFDIAGEMWSNGADWCDNADSRRSRMLQNEIPCKLTLSVESDPAVSIHESIELEVLR